MRPQSLRTRCHKPLNKSEMNNLIESTRQLLGLPVLASQHGHKVDEFIVYVHWLMIFLFIGWFAYFAFALFRFSAKRSPKADHTGVRNHASNYIEVIVALIEGVLLFVLAIPLWAKAVDQFPDPKNATVVKVAAQQFAWNVLYPSQKPELKGQDPVFPKQDFKWVTSENPFGVDKKDLEEKKCIQTLNEIHVVVNKPVIVYLTSKDVIHSFKIIAMRTTQDAIPGMMIPTQFTPEKTGVYQINCAQLCGNGHASMAGGRLYVDSEEDYAKWLAEKTKSGGGATSFE